MGAKEAYIETLRLELADLPAGLVAEIIGDFDRHFRDAAAAGRIEADAARRLGDPIWLAYELRDAVRSPVATGA